MNRLVLSASIIAAFTAAVHIFAGGSDVAAPLLASTMAPEPKLTMYSVWHMVTVALAVSAVALFMGSLPRYAVASRYLVLFISLLWLGFGIVVLAVALVQHERGWLLKLPQWILLLPVGIIGMWGAISAPAGRSAHHPKQSPAEQ